MEVDITLMDKCHTFTVFILPLFTVFKVICLKREEENSCSYLIHVHLFEATLENFEILYIFVLQIGLELDSFQRYTAREQHVHELTIDRSGAQLFDLRERGLQAVVYPRKHVVTTKIVGCHVCCVHVNSHVALFALTEKHRITD